MLGPVDVASTVSAAMVEGGMALSCSVSVLGEEP